MSEQRTATPAASPEAQDEAPESEVATDDTLEALFPPSPADTGAVVSFSGLRTARAVKRIGPRVSVRLRGGQLVEATLDASVEPALVDDAIAANDMVLVESEAQEVILVGVLATRRATTVRIEGERLEINGTEEILLRSGRSALRLRADGDVELVGSRISASSRGLFRLVGRLLRLN